MWKLYNYLIFVKIRIANKWFMSISDFCHFVVSNPKNKKLYTLYMKCNGFNMNTSPINPAILTP